MTESDKWGLRMLKWFDLKRQEHGDKPWPGYWAECILNYADDLKIVWC